MYAAKVVDDARVLLMKMSRLQARPQSPALSSVLARQPTAK